MKLLLDENLSHRLVVRLAEAFPSTASVHQVELRSQSDGRLSLLRGHPPKVIYLAVGNAGTNQVADLLLQNKDRIATFLDDQNKDALLTLSL